MGANTKELRTRIKSVNSTLHLTRAMGLVASSKIRRATDAMLKGRQYNDAVQQAVAMLMQSPECAKSPYMRPAAGTRTRIIVIAGDRGLAGGYNANIFRFCREYPDAEFIPLGKRAYDRFRKSEDDVPAYVEGYSFEDGQKLARTLCEQFANGDYDRLGIIWTKYISMMSQEPQITWVLPLEKPAAVSAAGTIFEPDELTILNEAVPTCVAGILMAVVRESYLSEVAARRMAMDSADKNATAMIDDLTLKYNRARQGAITQEITEIVAGAGSSM